MVYSDDQVNNFQTAQTEAQQAGIDPSLITAQMNQESGGQSNAVSSAGAIGPMQLEPGTARDLGVNPNDQGQNIHGGVQYLKQQLDTFGDPKLALMAYNWGPGNVKKWQANGADPDAVPDETKKYVNNILQGSHTNNAFHQDDNSGLGIISDANASDNPQTYTDDQVNQMSSQQGQQTYTDDQVNAMSQPDQGAVKSAIGALGHSSMLSMPLDAIQAGAQNLVNGSGFGNNWNQIRQQGENQYNTNAVQHPTATNVGNDAAFGSDLVVGSALGEGAGKLLSPLLETTSTGNDLFQLDKAVPTKFGNAVNDLASPKTLLPTNGALSTAIKGFNPENASAAGLLSGAGEIGAAIGNPALALKAYGLNNALPFVTANAIKNPVATGQIGGIVHSALNGAPGQFTPINPQMLNHPALTDILGSYAPVLKNAASRGPEALAATDFQMQQSYPDYLSRLRILSDQKDDLEEQRNELQDQQDLDEINKDN